MKTKLIILIVVSFSFVGCRQATKPIADNGQQQAPAEQTIKQSAQPEDRLQTTQSDAREVENSELPQSIPFRFEVQETEKTLKYGVQSFAFGQSGGKWLFVGGRTNGFHRTSTESRTFPTKYANSNFLVFDLDSGKSWESPIPEEYLVRLRATNMQFFQDGDYLFTIGGYGSINPQDDSDSYQTFPYLTAINVPKVIAAIIAGDTDDLASHIVSIEHEKFRVTGGVLNKVGDYFYLVFGQDYEKIYKDARIGIYTEEIRRFKINFDGTELSISEYKAFGDPSGNKDTASQYHRRDLNVTEMITPAQGQGLAVWGGVFTADAGGWPNPIYVEPQPDGDPKVTVQAAFKQKCNYYECANLPIYDSRAKIMYTTLFGGISNDYYNTDGKLVVGNQQNPLPFVNIITTIAVDQSGTKEFVQPFEQGLPALIGANAKFVAAENMPIYSGHILDLAKIMDLAAKSEGEPLLVGYIVGGILATANQTSGINPTFADAKIYAVSVIPQ